LLDSQCGCRTKKDECLAESESLAETQPSLRHAFKHVYGFILQAVKGDKAAADAIFEDYLAGKLSEKTAVNFAALRERGSSRLIQARGRGGLGGIETN
jgi:hypothetical protein